ncbi:MAG: GNAT family N-acetyltransferase [Alphaproteobacteria bacterium]|nr:GNAT family N-acetyltransferase [Alphaproteobacteria bacterium]
MSLFFINSLLVDSHPKKTLQGHDVFLELPQRKHGIQWVEIRAKNHGFLQPWEPLWDENLLNKQGYLRILKKFRQHRKQWRNIIYFIMRQSDNQLMGGITIGNIRFGSAASIQIGYWMGEEFTRNGYMQEAIALVTRYAFMELHFHRIEAFCMASNHASINLLKKCNFTLEGEARSFLEINGHREDHQMFSLLKTDLINIAKQNFKHFLNK